MNELSIRLIQETLAFLLVAWSLPRWWLRASLFDSGASSVRSADAILSPPCMSCKLQPGRTMLPRSERASRGFILFSCRCEENGGIALATLESCKGGKEVFQVETSSPTLALLPKPLGLLFSDVGTFGRGVDEEI